MKAIFLDRDGVINELIYYPEQGLIDSPFTVEQFGLCCLMDEENTRPDAIVSSLKEAGQFIMKQGG